MTCWAIIPAKRPEDGKMRLAEALAPADRRALVSAMLAHVIATAGAAPGVDRVCVVGPATLDLPAGVMLLTDPGGGLNPALTAAFAQASAAGASRVVILAGDLPKIAPEDVALLAAMPGETLAIAPDRHGTGTNALSLPQPAAKDFTFGFGPGSFAHHDAQAVRLRLDCEVVHRPGLARDIDEPADLRDARGLLEH